MSELLKTLATHYEDLRNQAKLRLNPICKVIACLRFPCVAGLLWVIRWLKGDRWQRKRNAIGCS